MYQICSRCHEYRWGICHCQPFEVAVIEYDQTGDYHQGRLVNTRLDWHDVYAVDDEQAAHKAVEAYNETDTSFRPHHAVVRDPRRRCETHFVVQPEVVIEYHVSQGPWDIEATRAADACGITLPDNVRPHSHLGSDYYAKLHEKPSA